ncbi:hypothetical protein [Paraburkholderia sp. IMGN_8]|uniref:hypothetical protein n=1 Tax=Paraburkholderia sp. IMGN_8 TaxID=3136564 RepID=UPI0032AF8426
MFLLRLNTTVKPSHAAGTHGWIERSASRPSAASYVRRHLVQACLRCQEALLHIGAKAHLFPNLIPNDATDGSSANRAQGTPAGQHSACDAANPGTDHGIRASPGHITTPHHANHDDQDCRVHKKCVRGSHVVSPVRQ